MSVLESKGREKGEAGALLFEVSCPLCCSRPSLGPPDDLSSCSFEGQYTPRGPDTRTNDENTDSSGQPPGVRPTKVATTYVTQSGGLWVPVPLSKPTTAVNRRGTRAEATRRALTFKTRRGGKDCVVPEAPDSHEWRRHTRAAKLEPGPCTAANQRNGPWPSSQAPGLLGWDVFTQQKPVASLTAYRAPCHEAQATRPSEPATLTTAMGAAPTTTRVQGSQTPAI